MPEIIVLFIIIFILSGLIVFIHYKKIKPVLLSLANLENELEEKKWEYYQQREELMTVTDPFAVVIDRIDFYEKSLTEIDTEIENLIKQNLP
jgi:hypothetical protein